MIILGKKSNRLILLLLTLGNIESLNVSSGRGFAHLGQERLPFQEVGLLLNMNLFHRPVVPRAGRRGMMGVSV